MALECPAWGATVTSTNSLGPKRETFASTGFPDIASSAKLEEEVRV
jgi:hypothetical protein